MTSEFIETIYETLCIPNLFIECDFNPFEEIIDNNRIKVQLYTARSRKSQQINMDYKEGNFYLLIDGFDIPFPDLEPDEIHLSLSVLKNLKELLEEFRPSIIDDEGEYNSIYHYPKIAYETALKHDSIVTDYTLDMYIEDFYNNSSFRSEIMSFLMKRENI